MDQNIQGELTFRSDLCSSGEIHIAHLSPRERTVLALIARGLSNKCIARELNIAPETVKTHTKRILAKVQAKNRAEAVAYAARVRLI